MDPMSQPALESDARLAAVLDEYFAALQAGTAPSKEELLARHADLAADLEVCLGSLDFIRRASAKSPHEAAVWAEAPSPEDPQTGTLGDYRILREIGRGGMGVVYEAEQISLGRRVALKVLPLAAMLDPKQLQRFKNEAHLAAQLHHTHIVPVFSVGCERGVHYYAMQYIDGRPLSSVIAELRARAPAASPSHPGAGQGRTSTSIIAETSTERSRRTSTYPRTIAHFGVQVAEALEHAHQAGIIHRDVKPANLLLDAKGTVWITDFGLAQIQAGAGLTMTGDLVGTVRYMSPEQASAKPAAVDHRTDIYSLGATLYELLTLEPAFPGDDRQQLMRRIALEEPKPPRRMDRTIPVELETIVLKAMAKNPASRYLTARELADDLERYLGDQPIRARRPSPIERATKFARRHRAAVWAAAAVLLVILLASLVSTALLLKAWSATGRALADSLSSLGAATAAREDAEENARRAKAAADRAEKAEREKTEQLYKSYLAQASAARRSLQPGQRLAALEALADAGRIGRSLQLGRSDPLVLRSEAIACLALPDLKLAEKVQPIEEMTAIAVDDPMDRYACARHDGQIAVCRFGRREPLLRIPGSGARPARAEFSPDGRRFLVQWYNGQCWLWDVDRGFVICKLALAPAINRAWATFTPDSRRLAVGGPDNDIRFYDAASGQPVLTLPIGREFQQFRFDPSGKLLAIGSPASREIQVWEVNSTKKLRSIRHPGNVFALAWRADGKAIASGGNDRRIYLWNIATGRAWQEFRGHQSAVTSLAFHPDGRTLVSSAWDGTARVWDAATASELLRLPGWGEPHFRADGRQLALMGGRREMSIWQWAAAPALTNLAPDERADEEIRGVDFSPDDRWLAASGRSGARLWDVARGAEATVVGAGLVRSPLFHGPSKGLITSGSQGLQRWPISFDGEKGPILGPPTSLAALAHEDPRAREAAISRDGRRVAVVAGLSQVIVVNAQDPADRVLLQGHEDVHHVAISPGGEWVATGSRLGRNVKLWDARSGRLARDLWEGRMHAIVAFSPDGKLLAANSGEELRVWATDSWKLAWQCPREGARDLPGPIAFNEEGTIVAIARSRSAVELVRVRDWQSLLALETPEADQVFALRFSHDGAHLAAASRDVVHLWHLRGIHERLAHMELDWAPAE